jgi:hypothetical protein
VRAELWIALRLLDGTAAPPAAPARPTGPTGRTGGPERRLVR